MLHSCKTTSARLSSSLLHKQGVSSMSAHALFSTPPPCQPSFYKYTFFVFLKWYSLSHQGAALRLQQGCRRSNNTNFTAMVQDSLKGMRGCLSETDLAFSKMHTGCLASIETTHYQKGVW